MRIKILSSLVWPRTFSSQRSILSKDSLFDLSNRRINAFITLRCCNTFKPILKSVNHYLFITVLSFIFKFSIWIVRFMKSEPIFDLYIGGV